MKIESSKDLLREGVECILGSWPLLRGVVDTHWREYDHRKLEELQSYYGMDPREVKMHTLSNAQIERLLCDELLSQLENYKMKPSQIEDFLRTFMDEVFDAVPSDTKNETFKLAEEIYFLRKELREGKRERYESAILLGQIQQQMKFSPAENAESDSPSDSASSFEEAVEINNKKKNSAMTIELDKGSLQNLSAKLKDEEEDWM